jgi:hypothetical protein
MDLPANPPEHLVLLTSVPSEAHAAIVIAALEETGLAAHTSGTVGPGFHAGALGWTDILVSEPDLPVARNTLRMLIEDSLELDWSQVDVGEAEG